MNPKKHEAISPQKKDTPQGKTLCEVFMQVMEEREEDLTRFWVEVEDYGPEEFSAKHLLRYRDNYDKYKSSQIKALLAKTGETESQWWKRVFSQIEKQKEGYL